MKVQLDLRPFTVPNFVSVVSKPRPREEGMQEPPKFALSELSEEALNDLCNHFRREVFNKAEKVDRWTK